MVKRLDRYIGGAAILGILVVWLALTVLMQMFNLLDQLGSTEGRYQMTEALWFVALTTPRSAYIVFPVSALLGALISTGGLAATNELVALRTAGVSRLRIAGSVLGATLLLTAPVIMLGEWLAPAAERQARAFKQSRILGEVMVGGPQGLWIRDGNQFVNIRKPILSASGGKTSVNYHYVVVYSFDEDARLDGITRARNATHDGDQWQLERVRQFDISRSGVSREYKKRDAWASTIKPDLLESAVTRPRYMSMRTLLDQMRYLAQNGLDDRVYRSAFWDKVVFPLTTLSLVLAGMPFVFGSARQQSLGLRIFIGMSLGGLFMIVNRAIQNTGDAYALPILLSTVGPPLLLGIAVIIILRRSA